MAPRLTRRGYEDFAPEKEGGSGAKPPRRKTPPLPAAGARAVGGGVGA
jgi:hypothetical protein